MNEHTPNRTAECPSELRLDRLLAGELLAADRDTVERHLVGCARCTVRRRRRQEEKRLFGDTWSPPGQAPGAAFAHRRSASVGRWMGVAAVAAAILLVAVPLLRGTRPAETTTAKGQLWLRFFVRDGASGAVRPGTPNEPVHPGDALRFAIDRRIVGNRYVAVVARDASGKVTVYFPEPGGAAAPAPATADGLLPYSILLDDTLGPEVLQALLCGQPVELAPVVQALRRQPGELAPPATCAIESITLIKRARP
jgi:hypothetical protein